MKNEDALLSVLLRNQFYRRQYFLVLGGFLLSLIVVLVLVIILIHVIRYRNEPLYFATDNVGKLIQIAPINKPNMTTDQVAAWTVNAVQKATSYDYVNFREQLQSAANYFTTYGWSSYMTALTGTKNLEALKLKNWIIQTQVVGQPKLIIEGLLGNIYAYKFEMPLLITTLERPYDDTSSMQAAWKVSVVVLRQPILQSMDGLAIEQLLITEGTITSVPQSSMSPG